MKKSIYTRIEYDKERETCVWVIADSMQILDELSDALLRAQTDVQDWVLSRRPILILPITDERESGYIFRDVALISPTNLPQSKGEAICYNYELAQLLSTQEGALTSPIYFKQLASSQTLLEWAREQALVIGGVHVERINDETEIATKCKGNNHKPARAKRVLQGAVETSKQDAKEAES